MVMPEDFLAALRLDPAAHAFYATLKRQSLFTIYHRLRSAKWPEMRQTRMAELLAKLGGGERPCNLRLLRGGVQSLVCEPNWPIAPVRYA